MDQLHALEHRKLLVEALEGPFGGAFSWPLDRRAGSTYNGHQWGFSWPWRKPMAGVSINLGGVPQML